jgi:serine/threonine protein kinase
MILVVDGFNLIYKFPDMEILMYDDNFIKFIEYFIDDFYCYIILELADGDLNDYLNKNILTEDNIKLIFKNILSAIKKLHQIDIIHLDIKLNNILYIIKDNTIQIKIADFGNSVYKFYPNQNCSIQFTPEYAAPEISKIINNKTDIYALGFLLYKLLTEFIAYDELSLNNKFVSKKKNLHEFHKNWDKISYNARDLINKMLDNNYNARPDIYNCLNYKWFR